MSQAITTPNPDDLKKQDTNQDTKKFRRVIQPKDADGKPVGQPNVFEADTEQELYDKIADGQANAILKIRDLSTKLKLSHPADPKSIEGAELRRDEPAYKPRELTADEKFHIAQQFKDPAAIDEAFDRLYEARVGRKVQDSAQDQQELHKNNAVIRARAEVDTWLAKNPQYYPTPKNLKNISEFLDENNLAWREKNIDIAYRELMADGLLDEAPNSEDVNAVVTEPRIEAHRIDETEPTARSKTILPGTFTRDRATGSGTTPTKKGPSPAEFAFWSADKKKKYLLANNNRLPR